MAEFFCVMGIKGVVRGTPPPTHQIAIIISTKIMYTYIKVKTTKNISNKKQTVEVPLCSISRKN